MLIYPVGNCNAPGGCKKKKRDYRETKKCRNQYRNDTSNDTMANSAVTGGLNLNGSKKVARACITMPKALQPRWAELTKTEVPTKRIKRCHIQGALNDLRISHSEWMGILDRFNRVFPGDGHELLQFYFDHGLAGDKYSRIGLVRTMRSFGDGNSNKRPRAQEASATSKKRPREASATSAITAVKPKKIKQKEASRIIDIGWTDDDDSSASAIGTSYDPVIALSQRHYIVILMVTLCELTMLL